MSVLNVTHELTWIIQLCERGYTCHELRDSGGRRWGYVVNASETAWTAHTGSFGPPELPVGDIDECRAFDTLKKGKAWVEENLAFIWRAHHHDTNDVTVCMGAEHARRSNMVTSESFNLTDDHILLLRRLNIGWRDYAYDGAPGVDLKRPFGNGDWENDVIEILEWDVRRDRDGDLSDDDLKTIQRLFREMEHVLHIATRHPGEEIRGLWVREASWYDWVRP